METFRKPTHTTLGYPVGNTTKPEHQTLGYLVGVCKKLKTGTPNHRLSGW